MDWCSDISDCTWFSKMVSRRQRFFFPSLAGLVLKDMQHLARKKFELQKFKLGGITFCCSSRPWRTPPLKPQMSPLWWDLSTLEKILISRIFSLNGHNIEWHYFYLAAWTRPPLQRAKQSSCSRSHLLLHRNHSRRHKHNPSRWNFRPDKKTLPVLKLSLKNIKILEFEYHTLW